MEPLLTKLTDHFVRGNNIGTCCPLAWNKPHGQEISSLLQSLGYSFPRGCGSLVSRCSNHSRSFQAMRHVSCPQEPMSTHRMSLPIVTELWTAVNEGSFFFSHLSRCLKLLYFNGHCYFLPLSFPKTIYLANKSLSTASSWFFLLLSLP